MSSVPQDSHLVPFYSLTSKMDYSHFVLFADGFRNISLGPCGRNKTLSNFRKLDETVDQL
jgi:hypothetical protein